MNGGTWTGSPERPPAPVPLSTGGMGLSASEEAAKVSYVRNIVLASVFLASIPLEFWFYGLAFIARSLIPVALIAGMAVPDRRHGYPRRSA